MAHTTKPAHRFNMPLFFLTCFTIVFARSLLGDFVYDDLRWIQDNAFIRDFGNIALFLSPEYFSGSQEMTYRPIATLSYMLDHALFGLLPLGYRLHNLLLHLIACALLFYAVRDRMDEHCAWWSTFLFCFHPLQIEAVLVPSLREEMQCAIFLLLAWKAIGQHRLWPLGAFAYVLALLSKEAALFMPIVLFAVWSFNSKGKRTPMPGLVTIVLLSVAYLAVRFTVLRSGLEATLPYVGGSLGSSVWTHATAWGRGILLTLVPIGLSVDPWLPTQYSPWSFDVLGAGLLLATLTLLAWWAMRKDRVVGLGLIWFLAALLPTAGLVPIVNVYADRYFYIPMLGLAMAFGGWAGQLDLLRYRRLAQLLVLWLCLLGFLSFQRVGVFQDNHTLWGDALQKLGGGKGLKFLNERLAGDTDTTPWTRYAAAHMTRKEYAEAAEGFREALRRDPNNPSVHLMLADTYVHLGQRESARYHYERAIGIHPGFAEAYNNLGVWFMEAEDLPRAEEHLRKALLLMPSFADAKCNLGIVLARRGNVEEAKALWNEVLAQDARHAAARWNLQRVRDRNSP